MNVHFIRFNCFTKIMYPYFDHAKMISQPLLLLLSFHKLTGIVTLSSEWTHGSVWFWWNSSSMHPAASRHSRCRKRLVCTSADDTISAKRTLDYHQVLWCWRFRYPTASRTKAHILFRSPVGWSVTIHARTHHITRTAWMTQICLSATSPVWWACWWLECKTRWCLNDVSDNAVSLLGLRWCMELSSCSLGWTDKHIGSEVLKHLLFHLKVLSKCWDHTF